MRGPVRAFRPRSPPPPPPPQPPQPQPPFHLTDQDREEVRRILGERRRQQQQRQPSNQGAAASGPLPERPASPQRPSPPEGRPLWIPVSDGTYAKADGCTVLRNYTGKLTITRNQNGTSVVRQEPPDSGFAERMADLERSFSGVRPRRASTPPRI